METVTPETKRLAQEVFRRVAIPYYTVFSSSSLGPETISKIIAKGLGGDAVARQKTVKTRIEASELGTWSCPRRSPGHPEAVRGDLHSRAATPLHPDKYHLSGLCPAVDPVTGERCNAPLKPEETHLHEFAASFGFLEQTDNNYIRGKFGLVAEYVDRIAAQPKAGRFFKASRAVNGLILYAVIERHGDFLLPALWALTSGEAEPGSYFLDLVRANLRVKVVRLLSSPLPRNAAFHKALTELNRHCAEWQVEVPGLGRQFQGKQARAIGEKTLSGYFGRTVSYLQDLGFFEKGNAGATGELTASGVLLVNALRSAGFLATARETEVPPTFEAIHDAFSVHWNRYISIFTPPVAQGVIERIVREAVLPGTPAPHWRSDHLVEEELRRIFRETVQFLTERFAGTARIDAVRLALFIYGIGTGRPLELDDLANLQGDGLDPNANAAVQIPLVDPKQFALGHARSGRRFWSVALARR